MPDSRITLLLRALDEAFVRKSWHGTNVLGSIRGLDRRVAAWRPARGRHNIHELVVHIAYWKYAVTRRITGAKRGGFPLKGSNWFRRPVAGTAAEWRDDVKLLKACHAELLSTVRTLSPSRLPRRAAGSTVSIEATIRGVAAHDVYHAGQIQLIKRLHGSSD